LDANTILQRSPDVTYQIVAEEAILIHLTTGTTFSLNKVGTEFWNMLDGAQTIEQHAALIANQYGVEAAIVVSDLLELAEKMKADNLITIL
jgi:hypothetical protein